MQKYLPKHLTKKSIALPEFYPKKRKNDWRGKPASWPDIRKNAQDGHIYFLVDDRYPIGLVATCSGGYKVSIDGSIYANYNSNAKFSILDWSTYTTTQGYAITYPSGATKAHIIDIVSQSTNNITAIHCSRATESGTEQQGVLWAHFNISNEINISNFAYSSNYSNALLTAITTKNNNLLVSSSLNNAFSGCDALEYLPVLVGDNISNYNLNNAFQVCHNIKKITIKDMMITSHIYIFANCYNLEEIKFKNAILKSSYYTIANSFDACHKLKYLPPIELTSVITVGKSFVANCESLQNAVVDASACSALTYIQCYGSSTYFMSGFKGLRVSNEAPFTATGVQINVGYTGMDRTALVQLFNDLPAVSSGQIINIVGCSGAADLTEEEALIPDGKGWTLTR